MECPNTKIMKPNSNISEIVCKLAKVRTLKSIGVLSSEAPDFHHLQKPICNVASLSKNISDASEESKIYGQKIHLQHSLVPEGEDSCASVEIMKIFDNVSALKMAYLQLQQAHIPYDPQKITAADERVNAELEKLCKFKFEYKEKQNMKAKSTAACFDLLQSKIEAKEAFLGKLKSLNNAKDFKILRLHQELQDLEMGNNNLHEKIKRMSKKRKTSVLSVAKFNDVFKAASKSIHKFARPLISLMKASGWDLDVAAQWIENEAVYSKRCDKKHAFEAYIARRMFHGVSLTSYDVGDIMKFDDPIDALMENPDSDFSKFCRTKYLLVVHSTMEESFFGNLDHRALILCGKHPRTEFYQLFAKMAKWIWVLVGSAASINPDATMFFVNRESMFSALCMQPVEEEREIAVLSDEERATYKVQFMIMPGFKIGQTLVKSRVYISKQC
ncbi:protein GRAVITROPIC IN THE LIGHT 1-like [Abrus precatorius]|uniref:Protein GRAVITROPIC IN THE LIGHT 1-like n=1 Tax=Abrus precatorius TaxID=3816 RepID=A0A8B8K137_ABRPR|nr:protein GRAVITROPIC IN THE LIGHT 1-like [Abrus precatorius]